MVEELFLLLLSPEEGVTLVTFPVKKCVKNINNISKLLATVGDAGWACPELTNFVQHSEQNTLCCQAQISSKWHFSNDGPHILNINNFVEQLALGGLNWIKSPPPLV